MEERKLFNKTAFLAGFVSAMIVLSVAYTLMNSGEDSGGGNGLLRVAFGAESDPGAGASGILEVFIVKHGTLTYTTNISESDPNVLGYGVDNFNIEIPHSTAFDIVVKCRANKTHAYDTAWNLSLIRCNITATGDITLTNFGMMEYEITSTNQYIWVNYVADNGGSGFTIPRDGSVTISSINFQYYG